MKRTTVVLAALVAASVVLWWGATRPGRLSAEPFDGVDADLAQGEAVFYAAGCASCHTAEDAEDDGPPLLSGGKRFPSPFGTFVAPNISPHPEHGIGAWTDVELAAAIMQGVSPEGEHYYPVFPYVAYAKADPADILSLVAYLRTLPQSDRENQPHEIGFPFNIRRNLGIWKRFLSHDDWVLGVLPTDQVERGRYLVEALSHCGECHTSRTMLGSLKVSEWLGGAPNPVGKGTIPNITPGGLDWSEGDIAYYLETGFMPDFDTAGGLMVEVIDNTSKLSDEDRAAIAAYLKAVPPVE